eukprot:1393007-Amorphochlora_amoeboformis.AAC.2
MAKSGTKGVKRAAKGDKKSNSKRRKVSKPGAAPSVKDIVNDRLTPLANAYWALGKKSLRPYDSKVIEEIYKNELSGEKIKAITARAVLLEFSSYLENYLWKNFDPKKATFSHVMSIMMMVNEKFREGVPVWDIFHVHNEKQIGPFFDLVYDLKSKKELTLVEKISQVLFLINCYSSLEDRKIRSCCMKYISLPMWKHISQTRLRENLKQSTKLEAAWKIQTRKKEKKSMEADFFPGLIKDFLKHLGMEGAKKLDKVYMERCMELFVDLLSRLPTRRFLRPLLVDCHFVVRCRLSNSFNKPEGRLLRQLLQTINFYEAFGIDDTE